MDTMFTAMTEHLLCVCACCSLPAHRVALHCLEVVTTCYTYYNLCPSIDAIGLAPSRGSLRNISNTSAMVVDTLHASCIMSICKHQAAIIHCEYSSAKFVARGG
jgi:hypothetical protein